GFFFQAEDGIRDPLVTGVQTCALPISALRRRRRRGGRLSGPAGGGLCRSSLRHPPPAWWGGGTSRLGAPARRASGECRRARTHEIGRASCRERAADAGRAPWLARNTCR